MTCSFEGCDKPSRALGLCNGHYMQQYRNRELEPLAPRPGRKKARVKICSAVVTPACKKPCLARGLCPKHYYRDRKGLPMEDK